MDIVSIPPTVERVNPHKQCKVTRGRWPAPLDTRLLTYFACPDCCLPQGWCCCAEVTADA
jgi:hypothetical protein